MHHEQLAGPAYVTPGGAAEPGLIFGKPGLADARGPGGDPRIAALAGAAERVEIVDEPIALAQRDGRLLPAIEARHPDLIGPDQMAERAMDRFPERATIPPPLRIAEPRGRVIEPPVHLGIVRGHRDNV